MAWYDLFATFYDAALEPLYRASRAQAAAALQITPGDTVLDLACGTGQNFPHLMPTIGTTGRLIGLDASPGMLRQARKRIDHNGWPNIHLIEQDARLLRQHDLDERLGQPVVIQRIVCTLGFSVIPDWQAVLDRTYALLPPGGRLVLVDVYAEVRGLQTWMVERMAQGDLSRPIVQHLETIADTVSMTYLPGSRHVYGGRLWLAVATKTT